MASCRVFKKSSMTNPLPASPDAKANPGEFGLIDNEDGLVTLAILDPAGNPSPIDFGAAAVSVMSDNPEIIEVDAPQGLTWHERVARGTTASSPSTSPTPTAPADASKPPSKIGKFFGKGQAQHPPPTTHPTPGAGAVATITVIVTWTDATLLHHTLTWKDTVNDPSADCGFERGPVTVS